MEAINCHSTNGNASLLELFGNLSSAKNDFIENEIFCQPGSLLGSLSCRKPRDQDSPSVGCCGAMTLKASKILTGLQETLRVQDLLPPRASSSPDHLLCCHGSWIPKALRFPGAVKGDYFISEAMRHSCSVSRVKYCRISLMQKLMRIWLFVLSWYKSYFQN